MPLQREAIDLDANQSFRILQWRDNLREVESVISPTQRVRIHGAGDRWHYHPEMELTIIQRGHGTCFVGDHIGPFEATEVFLIGPDVPHFWKGLQKSSGHAVQWHFGETHAVWQFPEMAPLNHVWNESTYGLRFTGNTATQVVALVQQMAETSGLARLALLIQLFLCLSQAPRKESIRLSKRPFNLAGVHAHQPAIERVIRHVLKHYREPIRLEEVLKIAAMSKATFARQFRKHAGKPFSAFVAQVRLDAACRELVGSSATISDAAFSCGFNSLSYFNRTFLKALKCSPKEYRKRASLK